MCRRLKITEKNIEDGEQLGASANATLLVTDDNGKKWVIKKIHEEEACIETIMGEIYRFLMGNQQPVIRIVTENKGKYNLASEFVDYTSFRELCERIQKDDVSARYRTAFQNDLSGFMQLLFASICWEENDLSAENYGCTGKKDGVFGSLIKIDHGQSLNSLRIKRLGVRYTLAWVKFFKPIELGNEEFDYRTKKKDRTKKTIMLTTRLYEVSSGFVNRCMDDFVEGNFTYSHIKEQKYFPSIIPLYDARLRPFLKDIKKADLNELKFYSIARILCTSDKVYKCIAEEAIPLSNSTEIITNRIIQKKRALFRAVIANPNFWQYFSKNVKKIRESIENCWIPFLQKENIAPYKKLRSMGAKDLIDDEICDYFLKIGKFCQEDPGNMLESTNGLIRYLLNKILLNNGIIIKQLVVIGGVRCKEYNFKVPQTIAMLLKLLRDFSPEKATLLSNLMLISDILFLVDLPLNRVEYERIKKTLRVKLTTQIYRLIKTHCENFIREILKFTNAPEIVKIVENPSESILADEEFYEDDEELKDEEEELMSVV